MNGGSDEEEPDARDDAAPPVPSPGPFLAAALTLGVSFSTTLLFIALVPTLDALASRAVAMVLGVGSLGALAAAHVPAPHARRLGLQRIHHRALVAIALLLPVCLLTSEIDNVARALLEAAPGITDEDAETLRSGVLWMQTLVVFVGIEPLVEEWFFRGVLQQGSVDRIGPAPGVAWCALLYGVYTALGRSGDGAEAIAIGSQSFALGLAFGYLRIATGSLLAPVLLHAAVNAIGILGGTWFPIAGFSAAGAHTDPLILFAAAVSCGVAIWWLETNPPPIESDETED